MLASFNTFAFIRVALNKPQLKSAQNSKFPLFVITYLKTYLKLLAITITSQLTFKGGSRFLQRGCPK